jgi:hypothetical protein
MVFGRSRASQPALSLIVAELIFQPCLLTASTSASSASTFHDPIAALLSSPLLSLLSSPLLSSPLLSSPSSPLLSFPLLSSPLLSLGFSGGRRGEQGEERREESGERENPRGERVRKGRESERGTHRRMQLFAEKCPPLPLRDHPNERWVTSPILCA